MDALSGILRVVHLVGAVFIQARFTAPWCYQSPLASAAAPLLDPGAERIVIFHLLTEGECVVEMPHAAPVHVVAGDVLVFPHGDAHRMASEPGLPAPKGSPLAEVFARRPRQLACGGGGPGTKLVCGYLACDDRLAQMLLSGLPALLRVHLRGSSTGDWLEASLRYALAEARSPRPGGQRMLSKLAEVLFIEVMRRYMAEQAATRTGWLAGAGDRIVGAALGALHERPAHAWTLDELARTAATSRSVLAERFQHFVGAAPMQYLTQWRMTLAADLLARSNAPLVRIAEDVGYRTDTAFSRAFRREFGTPPAAWRRLRAAREAGARQTGEAPVRPPRRTAAPTDTLAD
jgi:AraC-like DNA-binding protein